jgi:hypothetical protein
MLLIIVIILIIILFGDFDDCTNKMLQYYLLGITGIWLIMTSNYHSNCELHGGFNMPKMPKILIELKDLSKLSGDALKQKANDIKSRILKSMKPSSIRDKIINALDKIANTTSVTAKNSMAVIKSMLNTPSAISAFIAALI